MLIDPTFKEWTETQIRESVGYMTVGPMTEAEARQFIYDQLHPERPAGHPVGVFYSHQLDLVIKTKNQYPVGITRRKSNDKDSERFFQLTGSQIWELESYGLCDNVDQILSRYTIAEISDRRFCIGMCPTEKEGPGWSSSGRYIGTGTNENTYCYHIYELES